MKRSVLHFVADNKELKRPQIYAADGSAYPVNDDQRASGPTVVTSASLDQIQGPGEIIEMIRDPHDPTQAIFLRVADGASSLHRKLERDGRTFLPPALLLNASLAPSLPSGLDECGTPAELVVELVDLLAKYLDLTRDHSLLVATFALAGWFSDCFEAVPYLWATGPLGSGKTKLLRFLKCVCRKALMVQPFTSRLTPGLRRRSWTSSSRPLAERVTSCSACCGRVPSLARRQCATAWPTRPLDSR
jgi:hypothetical protein